MRIGVYGSKFGPPHVRHLILPNRAGVEHHLDFVYMVTAGAPVDNPAAAANKERRHRWMEVAIADNPLFRPCRIEVDRNGPAYMVETMREIRKLHGEEHEYFLIIGEDRAPTIATWHEYEELLKLCTLLIGPRTSGHIDRPWVESVLPKGARFDVVFYEESSTFIREAVKKDGPRAVRYLVTEAVYAEIEKNGLGLEAQAEANPASTTSGGKPKPEKDEVAMDNNNPAVINVTGADLPNLQGHQVFLSFGHNDHSWETIASAVNKEGHIWIKLACGVEFGAGEHEAFQARQVDSPKVATLVRPVPPEGEKPIVATAGLAKTVASIAVRKKGIRSILDNDLYKFSMANAVLQKYPNVRVGYKFTDRKSKGLWTPEALAELKARIAAMADLQLTPEERAYCEAKMPWINRGFWDFLALYRFDPSEVKVSLDKNKNLQIAIRGLWCRTILWEVPLLALVCEVFYDMIDTNWNEDGQVEKMEAKAQRMADAGVLWGDFGTRRRRHFEAQERVVVIGKKYGNFTGTSNVYLAMKHDVKPLGTMAHEWIMAHSALKDLRRANQEALLVWNDVYRGNLGTALGDTFGTDAFLRDFDGVLARLFDSVRHDSGDPYKWAEKMIAHYGKVGIDWRSKPLGFTDSNTDQSAIEIHNWVKEKGGRCWFGIGTSLSNDYDGSPALSIVIKLSWVEVDDGRIVPVVKLSDNPEKASGDRDAIRVALWTHFGTPLDGSPANDGEAKQERRSA